MYLKPVPDKKCGSLLSLKEVKKLCGKMLFRIGKYHVWRDSDGYYYVGYSPDWSKHFKEEYKRMSVCRNTAVYVHWIEGVYGSNKFGWFESEDKWNEYWNKISSEQPSYAATLRYEIVKRGYKKLPVEDRKLIYRLNYMNIERELKSEPPELVAKMWARYNSGFIGDNDELFTDIVKKICENIINIR